MGKLESTYDIGDSNNRSGGLSSEEIGDEAIIEERGKKVFDRIASKRKDW